MRQTVFAKGKRALPERLWSKHGGAPNYTNLPKNHYFLVPDIDEEVEVIGPVKKFQQGVTLRLNEAGVFHFSVVVQDRYLFQYYLNTIHRICYAENGKALIKAVRNGSWTLIAKPGEEIYFEEVRIVKRTQSTEPDPDLCDHPTETAHMLDPSKPLPDEAFQTHRDTLPLDALTVETLDRMLRLTLEFTDLQWYDPEDREEAVKIADQMTRKILKSCGVK